MLKGSKCAALTVALAMGLAGTSQAAVATFIFKQEIDESFLNNQADRDAYESNRANGALVLKDYKPSNGKFGTLVSWKYFRGPGPVPIYEVNPSDPEFFFSSDFYLTDLDQPLNGNVVTIRNMTSTFQTGLDNPQGGALLWNLILNPVCDDPNIPCGGGDGPQVDNNPIPTYSWRLASLAVPEPMTWVLMIGGFGAVGAQLRARHRRVA